MLSGVGERRGNLEEIPEEVNRPNNSRTVSVEIEPTNAVNDDDDDAWTDITSPSASIFDEVSLRSKPWYLNSFVSSSCRTVFQFKAL